MMLNMVSHNPRAANARFRGLIACIAVILATGAVVHTADRSAPAAAQTYTWQSVHECGCNDRGDLWAFATENEMSLPPAGERIPRALDNHFHSDDPVGGNLITWKAETGERLSSPVEKKPFRERFRLSPEGRR